MDVLTTPMFDKFYDELSALQEAITGAAADDALSIRKEIQSTAEQQEATGISYNKYVSAIKPWKWGLEGYDAGDEKERENCSSNTALKEFER